MYLKKTFSTLLLLLVVISSFAQMNLNTSTRLIVLDGTTLHLGNGLYSKGAYILNNGLIEIAADLDNNMDTLFDSSSSGTVLFKSSSNQEITGNYDVNFYGKVVIDNVSNVSITCFTTVSQQTINDTLEFISGSLVLNGINLQLGSVDAIGVNVNSYIVTNSIGSLKRNVPADGSTAIPFPVGYSVYNPISVTSGTLAVTDNYNIRVVDAVPGLFPVSDHIVIKSWVLTEDVSGGSDFDAIVQWSSADEDISFDRSGCFIGLTTDDGLTVDWAEMGAASGTDPYTKSGSSFNSQGVLFVADDYHYTTTLHLDFFLGGAYDGSIMSNYLNQYIPLEDPYGLAQTVGSVPSNAIDWVRIDIRDESDISSIIKSYAFFVDEDGKLLDTNGGIGAEISGISGLNYVSVSHRNHLSVTSSTLIDFSVEEPGYNFKSTQSQAWQDPLVTGNGAMKEVGGIYVLWPGDTNNNNQIDYTDLENDRIVILNIVGTTTPGIVQLGQYSDLDVNMDGNIIYNGTNSDRAKILYQTGINTPENIIYEHLP